MEFNLRITVIIVHVQMYDHLVFFLGGGLSILYGIFLCGSHAIYFPQNTHTKNSIHSLTTNLLLYEWINSHDPK